MLRPTDPRWAFGLAFALIALAGCGESDKSRIKVAEVEDRVITLDYFERKMNSMDPQFLPQDINSHEGRMEFLETIINKEVMALKAEELGFAQDGTADRQGNMVADFKAAELMRNEIVKDAQNVTEEEILDYYENLGRNLRLSYMLFDFEEPAIEAKRLVEGGEDWEKVATKFDAGDPGPQGNWTMTLKYGTVADDLERTVFALPVGEVSDPIDSVYGYFVVKVEGQVIERSQPLDTLRPRIIASIQKQKQQLLINDFIDEVFAQYNFQINPEALKLVWEALPPDAPMDPPTPVEDLQDLRLDPVHFDKVLMSWDGEEWTLRRYYDFYNNSSVFGRPRQEQRMGTLRRRLKEVAVRELMQRAARDRGYTDLPEIRDEFKLRREQSMVTRLHEELVKGQVEVTPEDAQRFWDENPGAFDRPERRRAFAIATATEQDALAAMAEAKAPNVNWPALVAKYNVDATIRGRSGDMGMLAESEGSMISRVAFELESVNDVSYPREMENGNWLVLRLGEIRPAENPTFDQVRTSIGEQLRREREEELFQQKVGEWREEFLIRIYEKNVDKAVYDPTPPKGTQLDLSTGLPISS